MPNTDSATIVNTAQNIKGTNAFYQFGKKMFGPNIIKDLKTNPQAILALASAAGIKIPPQVRIGGDILQLGQSLQMIASGGSYATNTIMAGSFSSYLASSALALTATVDILEATGLMKKDSPMAQLLTLGGDLALVISTSGVNVLADLKLILDIAQISQVGQAIADGNAQSNLRDKLISRYANESTAMQGYLAGYHAGIYDIYDLMELTALGNPDNFQNYFPQYRAFFPTQTLQIYAEGGYTDIFGYHGSNASQYIQTIGTNDQATIAQIIWNQIIFPTLKKFLTLNNAEIELNKITVNQIALLAMLNTKQQNLPQNFNAVDYMKYYDLTPKDLGETKIIDNLLLAKKAEDYSKFGDPAVAINGIGYITPYQQQAKIKYAYEQKLIDSNDRGDINSVLANPDCNTELRRWGAPAFTDLDSRNFMDYFHTLSLIKRLKNDTLFKNYIDQGLAYFKFLPDPDDFNAQFKDISLKIHSRKMNRKAINKVASFLNRPVNSLKITNLHEPGQPAVFM